MMLFGLRLCLLGLVLCLGLLVPVQDSVSASTIAVRAEGQAKLYRLTVPFSRRPKVHIQKGRRIFRAEFFGAFSFEGASAQAALPPGVTLKFERAKGRTCLVLTAPKAIRVTSYFQSKDFVVDLLKENVDSKTSTEKALPPLKGALQSGPPEKSTQNAKGKGADPSLKTTKDKAKASKSAKAQSVRSKGVKPAPQGPQKFRIKVQDLDKTVLITLTSDTTFPAAIFRRNGATWIVYDKHDADFQNDLKKKWKSKIHKMDHEQGLISLRLHFPQHPVVFVMAQPDGLAIELSSHIRSPHTPISVEKKICSGGDSGSPCVTLGLRTQKLYTWRDPDLGDDLRMALSPVAGQGVVDRLHVTDFLVLPAAQGVVVKPHVKDLSFTSGADQNITITRPGGLRLSVGNTHENQIASDHTWAGANAKTFFAFHAWGTQRAVDFSQPQHKAADLNAHVHSMKALLAQNKFDQVCRHIDQLQKDNPRAKHNLDLQALMGAACCLAHHYELAEASFAHPGLAQSPEIKIWLATLAARKGAWHRAVGLIEGQGLEILKTYPSDIYFEIAPYIAEATLNRHESLLASTIIDDIKARQPSEHKWREHVELLDAQYNLSQKQANRALGLLRDVTRSSDIALSAQAEVQELFAHVDLKTLSTDELVVRLESLRPHWSGRRFESFYYSLLAQAYERLARWHDALSRFDMAHKRTSDIEERNAIQSQATDVLQQIFSKAAASGPDVLKDLAIFPEFKHFLPRNDKGDKIILALVDRLQRFDLLDDAIALLVYLKDTRLTGRSQEKVTTRIAWLHLVNHHPEETLRVLGEAPEKGADPAEQKDRFYLKVQALIDLSRCPQALQLLAGDASLTADNLRVDCYWRQNEWGKVADLLLKQIQLPKSLAQPGSPVPTHSPSLTQPSPELLVHCAVALHLSGRWDDMRALSATFGVYMEASPLRETFALLTSFDDNARIDRMSDVPSFLKKAQSVSLFMKEYRDRIDLSESQADVLDHDAPLSALNGVAPESARQEKSDSSAAASNLTH